MRLTIAYNLGTHNNTYQQHVGGTHNKVPVGGTQPVTLW